MYQYHQKKAFSKSHFVLLLAELHYCCCLFHFDQIYFCCEVLFVIWTLLRWNWGIDQTRKTTEGKMHYELTPFFSIQDGGAFGWALCSSFRICFGHWRCYKTVPNLKRMRHFGSSLKLPLLYWNALL